MAGLTLHSECVGAGLQTSIVTAGAGGVNDAVHCRRLVRVAHAYGAIAADGNLVDRECPHAEGVGGDLDPCLVADARLCHCAEEPHQRGRPRGAGRGRPGAGVGPRTGVACVRPRGIWATRPAPCPGVGPVTVSRRRPDQMLATEGRFSAVRADGTRRRVVIWCLPVGGLPAICWRGRREFRYDTGKRGQGARRTRAQHEEFRFPVVDRGCGSEAGAAPQVCREAWWREASHCEERVVKGRPGQDRDGESAVRDCGVPGT
jgi:hypothetical protein